MAHNTNDVLRRPWCSYNETRSGGDSAMVEKQGSQVSRIRRETHAIQPMHTLKRHTSYFSRREITSIAPTNLRRYLTVEQVGMKWVSRT